jgi:hypothetical protein
MKATSTPNVRVPARISPAPPEKGGDDEGAHRLSHGVDRRLEAHAPELCLPVPVTESPELAGPGALPPEQLAHRHPGHGFLELGVEMRETCPDVPVGSADRPPEAHRHPYEDGEHSEDDQREAQVQEQHHGHDSGQGDDVPPDGDDAGGEHLTDGLHVAEDPRHETSHRIAVEERGRESLDVGEEGGPEIVHDPLAGPRGEIDLRVAGAYWTVSVSRTGPRSGSPAQSPLRMWASMATLTR